MRAPSHPHLTSPVMRGRIGDIPRYFPFRLKKATLFNFSLSLWERVRVREHFSPPRFFPLLWGEAQTARSDFPLLVRDGRSAQISPFGRDPPYSIFPLSPWEEYTHFSLSLWERVGVRVLFDPLFSCADLKKVVNEKGE